LIRSVRRGGVLELLLAAPVWRSGVALWRGATAWRSSVVHRRKRHSGNGGGTLVTAAWHSYSSVFCILSSVHLKYFDIAEN